MHGSPRQLCARRGWVLSSYLGRGGRLRRTNCNARGGAQEASCPMGQLVVLTEVVEPITRRAVETAQPNAQYNLSKVQ